MFESDGKIYRQINQSYKSDFDKLVESGLYDQLTKSGALIFHKEVDIGFAPIKDLVYKVIQPETIDFISYPYEWCFTQLKEAALLTLAIAKRALNYGMSLKDASAYNIQFQNGRAIFIDTLSFEIYKEGSPWIAYRQFCQHFLSPLALMAYRDVRSNQLLRANIDGIPLDLASKLLPFRSRLNFGQFIHIHVHSKSQIKYADKVINKDETKSRITVKSLTALLDSLIFTVKGLNLKDEKLEWTDYYEATNYTADAFNAKKEVIADYISRIKPEKMWDLGANTGEFSRLASDQGIKTIAFDIDHGAVKKNHDLVKAKKEKNILPLVMDLTNPSPSLGWHHHERMSLIERGSVDLILALALIHHLCIANNVPLEDVAKFFSELGRALIIEFVPRTDSQVKRLLATREDIFSQYSKEGFEKAFSKYYKIQEEQTIINSERILYFMLKK